MKVRVKYQKAGSFQLIGHLDTMRYFQKAVRRAGLDIAYSQGFSPHQLMTFAAPLALGVTSEGEYFDAEFHSLPSAAEFLERMNAQMVEGMAVKDIVLLPEHAKNSMSIVAASDYRIEIRDRGQEADRKRREQLFAAVPAFLDRQEIVVLKKTKKKEGMEDIRPGILKMCRQEDSLYMLLLTGSEYNLKPELVVESLCAQAGISYQPFDYHVHRLETYMKNEAGELVSLLESGTRLG